MASELELGIAIVAAQIKEAFGSEDDIEAKAKICFRAAFSESNTWFVRRGDDDLHFRIGIGALLIHVNAIEDHEAEARIMATMNSIKALSAAASGVPVDFSRVVEDPDELLPLLSWYREIKAR